jgi:hypothetical protein
MSNITFLIKKYIASFLSILLNEVNSGAQPNSKVIKAATSSALWL